MKRRKFLLTSGTALLGSKVMGSMGQQPVVGLSFDIVEVDSVDPSDVDYVLVDFQNFELVPRYVQEGDATITVTLDIDGYDPVSNQSTIALENGVVVDKSDLGSAVPVVLNSFESDFGSVNGSVTVTVDHTSVSDSYTQSFTIEDDSGSMQLQNGLVGWWPLHEWSGKANDLSGNENNGTLNGPPIQGVLGRGGLTGYGFNGSEYISVPTVGEMSSVSEVSVSYWVKTDAVNDERVFDFQDSGNIFLQSETHEGGTQGDVKAVVRDTGISDYVSVTGNTNILDEWAHVAFTAKNNGQLALYLNGSRVSTSPVDTLGTDTSAINRIAGDINTNIPLNGSMVDIRLYDRSLSKSEVQNLYGQGADDYTRTSLQDGSDSGAVSRYKFTSGNITEDTWGTNTLTNNAESSGTTTDAIRGDAKRFNGSSDELNANGDASLNFGKGSFSIMAWIKPNDLSSDQPFLSKRNTGTGWQFRYDNGNDNIAFALDDGAFSGHAIGNNFITPNNWYNVCAIRDSDSDKAEIYINGVRIKSGDISSLGSTDSSINLYIGHNPNQSSFFNGLIDDVRIYDRALNPDEVAQLYQWSTRGEDLRERTTTLNKSDMAGWWKLNETSGSTAYDSSGNGNDGTITGADPGGSSSPLGHKAYDFDGDDYVDTTDLNINQPHTFAVWVNADSTNTGVIASDKGSNNNTGTQLDIDSGDIRFWVAGSDGDFDKVTVAGGASTSWQNIVGVYDNEDTQKVYINGVKKASGSPTSGYSKSTNTLTVGKDATGGSNFDGSIADMRVYDRALSPQEVSYLYEQQF